MSFMVISYTKGYILGFNVQNSERSHSAGPRTGRGLTSHNYPLYSISLPGVASYLNS